MVKKRKKDGTQKGLYFVLFSCLCADAHMGKWMGVKWVEQWVVVKTKE